MMEASTPKGRAAQVPPTRLSAQHEQALIDLLRRFNAGPRGPHFDQPYGKGAPAPAKKS